jgi:hypothetical protein
MSEIKEKKWIRNYIDMVIDEVKDVPEQERESVPFRIKMTMKHKTFSEKFPSLLMMIVSQAKKFDFEQFNTMLDLMESVQTGNRNMEDVSKDLGQEYFDRYVSPHVDNKKENKINVKVKKS